MAKVTLAKLDARRLMARHHFRLRSLREVFDDLGSVQFDPLNPVGRNHDLVLQARVPDYKIDDWQPLAYEERQIYDFWDKQASLVRMADWPKRRIFHDWHKKAWEAKVFKPYAEHIPRVLSELRERGPLSSSQFEYQPHIADWEGSWYGPKLTKNILRALWHSGEVVTHSRKHNHHVYDLAENVIPAHLLKAEPLSHRLQLEFLIKLRHQAVGLLRPNASQEVWNFHVSAQERKQLITELLDKGELVELSIEGQTFHALSHHLSLLDEAEPEPRMIFLAPLDQFIWDRKAIEHIFEFEYLWEVYKPEKDRQWGYYVLPVFYRDALIARFDSRLKGKIWELLAWYWEKGFVADKETLEALSQAITRFMRYLGAKSLKLPKGLDRATRSSLLAGARHD